MHGSTTLLNHCRVGLVLATLVIAALGPNQGFGGTDPDHEALARLIHEISALELLIDEAEAQSSPDARIRFQYDWLRQDLEKIRRGIEDHLEAPRAEPRPVPPLRGDYRR